MKSSVIFLLIIFISVFLSVSCHENHKAPFRPQNLVKKVNANKTEFEKVIENYKRSPKDSLKLKAAYYLIKNMNGWFYYKSELLDHYQDYLKLIRKDQDHGEYFLNSFYELYGPFITNQSDKKFDVNEIKAYQIIENINIAFKVWKEQPWGRDITFNQFCEYILPFRIADETPEYNREQIYNQFNKILDSVRKINGDVVEAATAINKELAKPQWIFSLRTTFLPHYKASQIIKYKDGSCREMTDLAFYVMRAVGIPVAIDFVPQWPYRSMGHEFNVLLDKNGKSIIFLGAEDCPGTPHKAGTKKGKIFRHTYAKNPYSLGAIKSDSDIVPDFLANPRMRDVTDQYVRCTDVKITLQKREELSSRIKKYVYICVFDNKNWVPVNWSRNINNQATFTKMEGGITYIAGYFDGSKIIPASDPFLLKESGDITLFKPNLHALNKRMSFNRIFPLVPDAFNNWCLLGCFQAANKSDFSDAINLYTVKVKPFPFWNNVEVKTNGKFRYVRFFSNLHSQMGELEFYGLGKKLKGRAFGSAVGWHKNNTFDKAFDNNIFTYFDSEGAKAPAVLGLDFGKKVTISKIRFSAPIQEDAKVKIVKGHNYGLFLWNHGQWQSLAQKVAKDSVVSFQRIPSQALYFLHDRSEKVAERIFTFENGKLSWW